MYISILDHTLKGRLSELNERVRESVVPILKSAPGFIAYYVVDTNNDTATTICVYDTEANCKAGDAAVIAWVQANVSDYFAAPPTARSGDVLLEVRADD